MPVIFLANKYDDVENADWSQNVKEIESKIEKIFEVSHLQSKTQSYLEAKTFDKDENFPYPAFLPCSAQYALIYLSALCDGFTIDHFKKLPFDSIDRFGQSDVGNKKWRLLKTKEEKYIRAFKELEDVPSCKLGLRDANFDKVISLLDHCLASEEGQVKLINCQLDYEMQSKQQSVDTIIDNLRRIHKKKKVVLGQTTDGLVDFFWENYDRFENEAFDKLKGPGCCSQLSHLMQLLIRYNKFSVAINIEVDQCVVLKKMASLVRRQMKVIVDKATAACVVANSRPMDQKNSCADSWENMSFRDWFNLIDSMINLNFNKKALEEFAADLRELRFVYHSVHDQAMSNGAFALFAVPNSAGDSNHWGHLLQEYSCFLNKKRNGRA